MRQAQIWLQSIRATLAPIAGVAGIPATHQSIFSIRLTLSNAVYCTSRRRPVRIGKPGDKCRKLVDEAVQKLSGAFIRDGAIGINEAGLEADIRLPAHDEHAQGAKNLPQVLLCDRRTDGAGRCAGDGRWLMVPGILAVRPCTPVDGVLQDGRD